MKPRGVSTILPIALASVMACAGSGSSGHQGTGSGGSSNNNSGGTVGSTGGAGMATGTGGTGAPGNPNVNLSCPSAQPGSPTLRLLTRTELTNTLNDVFPEVQGKWSAALPASTVSARGFDNDSSATVGAQLAGGILDTALSVATAVSTSSLAACSTTTSSGYHACAQTFLQKYGRRLFRRSLSSSEQSKYLAFFDASLAKSDFPTALKWMTAGLIQSPNTVYRSELGTDMGNGTRQLSPVEVATELAYTYTGSAPSDALISAAESGNLGDVAAQARTMIASPAGKEALQHFFEQYIGYSAAPSLQKPNIPSFSQVSSDMVQETRAFIDQIVIQNGGGLTQLLTAPTTNPSKALAAYYNTGNASPGGFPTPSSDYASVTRPAGTGVGILAQGAFTSTHASAVSSSPTQRGLFIYYKLFCQPKLTPPPDVPSLDASAPAASYNTTRERYEAVHEKVASKCAACHTFFDPLGFGFEHFDEGGRYRTKEGTYPIDSAASAKAPDGTTLSFNDEQDLMTAALTEPVVHQCLAAYLATYAYGSDEDCLGATAVPDLQSGKIGIAEAFARLATEPHFTTRASQ